MTKHKKETFVRFLHNIEGAPSINVLINDIFVARNLIYKDFTAYLPITTGKNYITVKTVDGDTVIIQKKMKIESEKTFLIGGSIAEISNIKLFAYNDDLNCPKPGYSHLRFIHGVFGAPNVDLYIQRAWESTQTLFFSDVSYGNTGKPAYKPFNLIPPQESSFPQPIWTTLTVKLAGTETVVMSLNTFLVSGGIYSFVASGSSNLSILQSDDNTPCDVYQKDFDVVKYMGKWYQIASIPQFYETNCPRQTAEYTLLSDNVTVFNTCYDEEWNINSTIRGAAFILNPCNPAGLRVVFPNFPNSTQPVYTGVNYIVHKTDYIDYALIGSPTRTTLYILSRTSKMSQKKYNKLKSYAKSLGYDTSMLRINYHALN
jgi:apolipoprotein D and lipocalin family protein